MQEENLFFGSKSIKINEKGRVQIPKLFINPDFLPRSICYLVEALISTNDNDNLPYLAFLPERLGLEEKHLMPFTTEVNIGSQSRFILNKENRDYLGVNIIDNVYFTGWGDFIQIISEPNLEILKKYLIKKKNRFNIEL